MKKYLITLAAATLLSNNVLANTDLPDKQAELPAHPKTEKSDHLVPRDFSTIPNTPFGDKVKQGYSLFVNTQTLQGKYVNNQQNCVNCHMQAGMKADSAPLWGAFMAYPAYRSKNDKVNTYAERIQGCFTYSMNGTAPPTDSPELVALSAYSYWLAMGGLLDKYGMQDTPIPELSDTAVQLGGNDETFILPAEMMKDLPAGKRGKLAGRSFPKLDKPEQAPSIERGEIVYNTTCASCHGANGEGIRDHGVQSFPPLWGKDSFNWGAGMHRVNTAAFFIYENMPLGKSIQITKQEAWDVAAFMNSHERPQDPRYKGDLKANQEKYHNHQGYYGKTVNGKVLGEHSY
ncbi:c-type cytochrome [Aliivibrio sp. 1S128]|uniref:c-type cytochrome n=1 Tax=Aliivibrio sp. 1S128 TaxID=1840085 RepID=UPI00080E0C56|nr:c-type cytochrome [Aliivibrio sp. 1S128]OCH23593.1 cytochrome C [Aliivibrio sp. 1S128]